MQSTPSGGLKELETAYGEPVFGAEGGPSSCLACLMPDASAWGAALCARQRGPVGHVRGQGARHSVRNVGGLGFLLGSMGGAERTKGYENRDIPPRQPCDNGYGLSVRGGPYLALLPRRSPGVSCFKMGQESEGVPDPLPGPGLVGGGLI